MKDSHINVTITGGALSKESYDMRIPRTIETKRLILELEKIFKCQLCKKKYQLRVVNKGFVLDEGKYLSDFLITDGDTIEVMEN